MLWWLWSNPHSTYRSRSLVLFLIFFRYGETAVSAEEASGKPPSWRTAATVGLLAILHGLLVAILTAVFIIAAPRALNSWANILGIMATVLAGIQYVPQIYTTYTLKHVGSLSIPMMCIQTPGGVLFAVSLFARLGWEGWSTWMIYVLTATMQGCVLVMGVYYELAARRQAQLESCGSGDGVSSSPTEHQSGDARQNRPIANRTYSEGWERGLPGPFTGHPERYVETEEDLDDIQEREARAVARESQPLLRPGGIGNPHKGYDGVRAP